MTFVYIFCWSPSRSSPDWLSLTLSPVPQCIVFQAVHFSAYLTHQLFPSSLLLMFGNLFILLTAYFFSSLVGFTYRICSSSLCFSGASGGRDTKASVFSPNLNWTLRLLPWWEEIKCVGTAFSPYAEKNALCFSHSKHRWEVFSISTIDWVFKF